MAVEMCCIHVTCCVKCFRWPDVWVNVYSYNRTFSTPLRFTLRHLLRASFEATVGRKATEASLGFSDWWFNSAEYV